MCGCFIFDFLEWNKDPEIYTTYWTIFVLITSLYDTTRPRRVIDGFWFCIETRNVFRDLRRDPSKNGET